MSASSDDDALERQRPPAVAVPHDGEYGPGGPGKVHSASPGLALRKMGKGPAFTPIRENSNPNALDSDRSHGSHIGAGFLFLRRIIAKILAFINSIAVQSSLYLAYVIVFQLLTASIRLKEEYHFDKMIADTFLDNHFDAAHNTFQTMRRVPTSTNGATTSSSPVSLPTPARAPPTSARAASSSPRRIGRRRRTSRRRSRRRGATTTRGLTAAAHST